MGPYRLSRRHVQRLARCGGHGRFPRSSLCLGYGFGGMACDARLRGGGPAGSWMACKGSGGSNPLNSTRHNASAGLPLRAISQQIVSRSRFVT
jgi:hypothetical protein